MPQTPINFQGSPGPDFFTLAWQRPNDPSIVGYQVSFGNKSGLYPNVIDVGNVTTFTISPLSFDTDTFAIVQSFDSANPPNLSAPAAEVARTFPITPPVILVAVPDPLASGGGVNDLFWVNPIDPNLRGQVLYRSKGALSRSGASPATSTVSGQTLTLNLNGDGVQTIILATNATAAAVAADIQAKVRSLTANDLTKQALYRTFVAAFVNGVYDLQAADTFSGTNTVVVTGGTAAPSLKLGTGNGGTETAGTGTVTLTTISAPLTSHFDNVGVNGVLWAYAIKSTDFSNPAQLSSPQKATVVSTTLLGSSAPSAPKNLQGDDNGVSILLTWNTNPEPNIASYEVHWATSLADLTGSPTVVNAGFGTTYVLSGFQATDDVYVEVFAVDDGKNPDGSSRAPFKSGQSNIFSRVITQGGIDTVLVLQTDQSNNATLIWNNIPSAAYFEVQIDVVPTFDSTNLVNLTRFIKVEDLVYLAEVYDFPQQRNRQVTWYWRVRPVYPGPVMGLYNTQIRESVVLNGFLPVTLGATLSTLPTGLTFLPSITVTSGVTTYIAGVDYEVNGNQVVRKLGSSITDGQTVNIVSEFVQSLIVGINRRAETRDRLHKTLDPLYYGGSQAAKTTNIFKWFQAISRGALADYVIANRQLMQGNVISTTVPTELYERYGGMVTLTTGEIPMPDAYAAVQALYPAFLTAGTVQAVQLACKGLTGRNCEIKQSGTGAGSGWILYDDAGPNPGQPDFVFSDFPGVRLPINTFEIVLADFDDLYNWNITVNNSARGVEKSVVRDARSGLEDFLGVTNIVPGSLRLIDSLGFLVDTTRYTPDYVNGTVTWNSQLQALPTGEVYTAICGAFITDLIKRVLNEILPAHVNPIYTFLVQNLAQTLGLLVYEDAFWDEFNWAQ